MSEQQSPAGDIREWIQEYYGKILASTEDLKTDACCATGAPEPWLGALLANVHQDVLNRFYGCGFPIPFALEGKTVVDLGSGSGRDVYLLSQLVGPKGRVIGVDMTDSQLEVARNSIVWHMDRFGYDEPNVSFHQAYIEDLSSLPLEDGSVDLIVSNCVVNLSPRKDLVMAECARLLAPGGEFYLSDVFCDRRLPAELANDPILYGECLGGALYRPDFMTLARKTGFADPRIIRDAPISIGSDEISAKIGAANFNSTTVRLFALDELEERCEDYGQIATYKGTIAESGSLYRLDDHHLFEAGRPERVCANTAAMLSATRLSDHFEIQGDTSTHFGPFDCGSTMAQDAYGSAVTGTAGVSAAAKPSSCC